MTKTTIVMALLGLFAVTAACLVDGCTAAQQTAALDAAKTACVVIDHVPVGSQMYVFVRPIGDGGTE